MKEFPQFTFEDIGNMTLEQVDFLLGGLEKYYSVKRKKYA